MAKILLNLPANFFCIASFFFWVQNAGDLCIIALRTEEEMYIEYSIRRRLSEHAALPQRSNNTRSAVISLVTNLIAPDQNVCRAVKVKRPSFP